MEEQNKNPSTIKQQIEAAQANRAIDEAGQDGAWEAFANGNPKPVAEPQPFVAVAPDSRETSQSTEVDPKTVEMIEEIGATAMSELEHEGQTFGDRTLGDEIEASKRPGDRNL